MNVTLILGNRFTDITALLTSPWGEGIANYFLYIQPDYQHTPRGRAGWDGVVSLLAGTRVGTGLLLVQLPKILSVYGHQGLRVRLEDRRIYARFYAAEDCPLLKEPRPYQERAYEFMRWNANQGGLLRMITGSGKTLLAAAFFSRLAGRGLFLLDDLGLAWQAKQAIQGALGEEVGIVGDGKRILRRINIGLTQSLGKLLREPEFRKWYGRIDAVLIDELHTMFNELTYRVVAILRPLCCFGLTSTLDETNKPDWYRMASLCGDKMFTYDYTEAIKEGYLTQGFACFLDVFARLEEGNGNESPQEMYRKHVVNQPYVNQFVLCLACIAVEYGYRVLVLTSLRDHTDLLCEMLEAQGIAHEKHDGRQTAISRRLVQQRLHDGAVSLVLASDRTMSKGADIPALDCILDITQGKSGKSSRQRAGRGVRLSEGKDHFLYFDFAILPIHSGRRAPQTGLRRASRARRADLTKTGYVSMLRTVDSLGDLYNQAASIFEDAIRRATNVTIDVEKC